jgi:hypothetical protein
VRAATFKGGRKEEQAVGSSVRVAWSTSDPPMAERRPEGECGRWGMKLWLVRGAEGVGSGRLGSVARLCGDGGADRTDVRRWKMILMCGAWMAVRGTVGSR